MVNTVSVRHLKWTLNHGMVWYYHQSQSFIEQVYIHSDIT